MSYNTLEDRTYTLYLQSSDKISGSNNNGQYLVDWTNFLPVNFNEYKVIFSFTTVGGYYKDNGTTAIYSTARVSVDFGSRNFNFDTSKKGSGLTLGYITRDQQTSTTSSNILSCFFNQNPGKTIGRPCSNIITVTLTNMYSGLPLVNTDNASVAQSDSTAFQMCLEFIPIQSSFVQDMRFQNL